MLLDEIVTGYQHAGGVVLPLGHLSHLLDLAIEAEPATGTATGFILNVNRRFDLDVLRGEVSVEGEVSRFNRALVLVDRDDIYISSALLSLWLPIDVEVDLYSSRITIRPREMLPMQARKQREQRIKQIHARAQSRDDGYLYIPPVYRGWSTPFLDQSLTFDYVASGEKEELRTRFSSYFTGQLAYMDALYFLEGDDLEPSRVNYYSLSRKDPNAGLFGFFKATEASLGYVTSPSMSLVSKAQLPLQGYSFGNYPLQQQSAYNTHTFQGVLPEGWEVELYHNTSLIDYQSSNFDRQYKFEDVQMLFGDNYFQLVFYGPEGQRREESVRFDVGRSLTPPGKMYYRFAQRWDENSQYRMDGQLDYGLHNNLSTSFGFASYPMANGLHEYGVAGAHFFFRRFNIGADYVFSSDDSWAQRSSLQTRIFGINVNSKLSLLNNFVSEVYLPQVDPIVRQQSLRLDMALPLYVISSMPLSFEYDEDYYRSDTRYTRLSARGSLYLLGFSLSNSLAATRYKQAPVNLSDSLQLSRRLGDFGFRANSYYVIKPQRHLQNVNVTLDGFLTASYRFSVNLNKLIEAKETRYSVSLQKTAGRFSTGIDVSWGGSGNVSGKVKFFMGLGRDNYGGDWYASARQTALMGAASANVYIDKNQNGVRDESDQGLRGVRFLLNGAKHENVTDENGHVLLASIGANRNTRLELDIGSLEDPMLSPVRKGLVYLPRPGVAQGFDFPVLETGEIDGTVYFRKDGEALPVADVELQLVDDQGAIVRQARSAYDGFYILEAVPLGRYQLKVSEAQIQRLQLKQPDTIAIEMNAENLFISGEDLVIER